MFLPKRIISFTLAATSLTVVIISDVKSQPIWPLVSATAAFEVNPLNACLSEFDKKITKPNDRSASDFPSSEPEGGTVNSGEIKCSRNAVYDEKNGHREELAKGCKFYSGETKISIYKSVDSENVRGTITTEPVGDVLIVDDYTNASYLFGIDNKLYFFDRDGLEKRAPYEVDDDKSNEVEGLSDKPVAPEISLPSVLEFDKVVRIINTATSICLGPTS